jgi:hypothetical protein
LADEIWVNIPADLLLGSRLSKQAEEEILDYGEMGL